MQNFWQQISHFFLLLAFAAVLSANFFSVAFISAARLSSARVDVLRVLEQRNPTQVYRPGDACCRLIVAKSPYRR